jgi:hypothetical protein
MGDGHSHCIAGHLNGRGLVRRQTKLVLKSLAHAQSTCLPSIAEGAATNGGSVRWQEGGDDSGHTNRFKYIHNAPYQIVTGDDRSPSRCVTFRQQDKGAAGAYLEHRTRCAIPEWAPASSREGGLSTPFRDASAGVMVLFAVVHLDTLDGAA